MVQGLLGKGTVGGGLSGAPAWLAMLRVTGCLVVKGVCSWTCNFVSCLLQVSVSVD